MMKFITLVLSGLLCICSSAFSQKSTFDYFDQPRVYEAGISLGAMNSLTDLGGRRGNGKRGLKDLNLDNTNFTAGAYGRIIFKNKIGLRLEASFGRVKGDDNLLQDVKESAIERYDRNLSFRSNIYELNAIGELYPLSLFGQAGPVYVANAISPYLMIGVGYYHFNPQAELNGQWIDLQPLRTEGEGFKEFPDRKEYHRSQVSIPMGFGGRYQVSDNFNIGLEFLFRKLFTDYLDDVSTTYIDPILFSKYLSGTDLTNALALNNRTRPDPDGLDRTKVVAGDRRGNSTRNDHFFSVNLKVGYVFSYKNPNKL